MGVLGWLKAELGRSGETGIRADPFCLLLCQFVIKTNIYMKKKKNQEKENVGSRGKNYIYDGVISNK